MADTNTETKELSASAEEYLWGVIYCADWIKPAYKKFADAYRTNPKALRELYLCFCDKVPETALKEAAKNDRVDVAFKLCRKEHLEKEWLGEYAQKLQELSSISGEIGMEVKQMSGTVSNIADAMPDWDAMFSKEIPDVLPALTVTTELSSKSNKTIKQEKTSKAEKVLETSSAPSEDKIEKTATQSVIPKKKGKGSFLKLLKKKVSEFFHLKSNPSRLVLELYSQGYSDSQINFILDSIELGMTKDEIDKIADPKISVEMMTKLRNMHFKEKGDMKNGK